MYFLCMRMVVGNVQFFDDIDQFNRLYVNVCVDLAHFHFHMSIKVLLSVLSIDFGLRQQRRHIGELAIHHLYPK